jgi:hypothetical protein
MVEGNDRVTAEDICMFYAVFQLSDVPWPVIVHEYAEDLIRLFMQK